MIKENVNLGVSFEVLEDIQKIQRQNYEKVLSVIRRYMEDGVDITVKSIITPQNVNRMEEMVYKLSEKLPGVKKYKLQIVEDPLIFADLSTMSAFYKNFTDFFFNAQKTGYQMGIDVYVIASKYVYSLIEHYCGGEMCLNPSGGITICHRFSSPKETNYPNFLYGSIDEDGTIHFDRNKFRQLIRHDISFNNKCKKCFVKWHCGGGCLAQASIYSEDQLNIICDWTRDFTFKILEKQLKKAKTTKNNK